MSIGILRYASCTDMLVGSGSARVDRHLLVGSGSARVVRYLEVLLGVALLIVHLDTVVLVHIPAADSHDVKSLESS